MGKVVEVEKEIQKKLEVEKKKSKEWIDKIKADSEKEISKVEFELEESLKRAVQDARSNADKEAAAILEHAHERSGKIRKITDESLRKTVMKHIQYILRGSQNDR